MFIHKLSETVEVRVLESRHAEEFHALVVANHERLARWCPWIKRTGSIESTREFLLEKIARLNARNGFTAGIFVDRRLSGVIALEYIDWENASTEIGYWIDYRVEGRGIVISACRSMIAYAFSELELERIQIRCAVENTRSRAIPKRLGFAQEGILRRCERLTDRTVDLVVYAQLRNEWPEVNAV